MAVMERTSRSTRARQGEGERAERSRKRAQQQQEPQPLGNQATLRVLAASRKLQNRKPPAQEPDTPEAKADQIVDRFEADPMDQSGRTRADLEALAPEQRDAVLGRVEDKVSQTQFGRIDQILDEPGPRSPGTPRKEEKPAERPEGQAPEPPEAIPAEEGKQGEPAVKKEEDKKEEKRPDEGKPEEQPPQARNLEDAARKEKTEGEKTPGEKAGKEAPAEDTQARAAAHAKKADPTKGEKPDVQKQSEATEEDRAEGQAEAEKAAKATQNQPAEKARQTTATATAPGQAQAADALADLPAVAKGADAQAAAAPGAPARQAAAQSGPAVTVAGGGGGGGEGGGGGGGGEAEAALEEGAGEESPEQEAAAENAEEKMAAAEPATPEESEEPEAREPEPALESGEELKKEPTSEDQEAIKQAEREREEQTRSPEGAAATQADEEEEEAAPAAQAEVNPAEARAGLESLAEGGGSEPAGGGGGGGGAISDQPEPEPPKVDSLSPVGAIGAVSGLKVGQIAGSIAGVQSSVSTKMSAERSDLAANAPSMERPSGSPQTREGRIEIPAAATAATAVVEETPAGEAIPVEEPEPLPDPGPSPADQVAAPPIQGGGEGGTLTEADAENVEQAVGGVPTTDPALDQTAGPPPTVELTGDADPQQAADQRAALDRTIVEQQQQGTQDLAQPMGEDEIYPVVPQETLTATVQPAGAGGGTSAAPAADDETAAIVAEEKQGDDVRASAQQASTDMQAGEEEHATSLEQEKADHEASVQNLESENAALQSGQRSSAASQVQQLRGKWSQGQQQAVGKAQGDATAAQASMSAEVAAKKQEGDAQATAHIEKGNAEAVSLKDNAETEAAQKKAEAEQESSGGILGWIASKAAAFFEGLKKAVHAVFDLARKALKSLIDGVKKLAAAAIDLARDAIVGAIRLAGKAIVAVGDVVLAAFPELRDQFRGFIEDKVKAAEDTVNKLADDLKAGINKLLDLLASALNGLLNLLEKAYMAAINVVAGAVQGAIKAAQAAIALLGLLAAIIKDVAANPGQWISNLGAAVIDGIKNHLWKAFKAAVKNWFLSKLEEVLGLGMTIFNVLFKGGIKLAEIGKMAFEGLKAAIPVALIGILVEKLVAMIVPAAGAVMVIIESLQAAWGTISRILQAIDRFVSFLKAVKSGAAGPKFADAIAAAAVVVIDFVANWLVKRIRKPAGKIGGKIKAIARKILDKLKAVAKKIGKAVKKAFKKVIGKVKKLFKRKKSRKKNKRDSDKAKETLDKAVRALRPQLQSMLSKPVSGIVLRAKLGFWRLRYRIKGLTLSKGGRGASIKASNSAPVEVINAVQLNKELVMRVIREAGHTIISDPGVQGLAKRILAERKAGFGTTRDEPLQMTGSVPAGAAELGSANVPPFRQTRMEIPAGGGKVPVTERQSMHAGAPGTVVSGPGKTGDVTSIITDLGGPAVAAQGILAIQSGSALPSSISSPDDVRRLTEITRLSAVETARDPSGEVSRLTMRLSEAESGGLTAAEMKGATDPIGAKGGTGTAGHISRGMGFEAPGKRVPTQAEINTFASQELDLAARFIASTAQIEKFGGSVQDFENFIKKQLKDKLISLMRSKYGL
jgi:hypothetical protein